MAYAIGVTVADLRAVDRDDAAEILAEMEGSEPPTEADVHDEGNVEVEADYTDRDGERIWFVVPKGVSPEDRERLRRMAEALAEQFLAGPNEDEDEG